MSHLVTNAQPRTQAAYGRFQPRANTKQYGVIYAALEGAQGFPHIDEVREDGVPIGVTGSSLRYDEYRDANDKPHDVTLPNGQKVREMICPIDEVRKKEHMEANDSADLMQNYTTRKGVADRVSPDGRVHLSSEITERRQETTFTPHDEETRQRLEQARAPKARSHGWTPERRAAASAAAKARHNKSQPATT